METVKASYSRTMEEVQESLKLAVINESDLLNVTQILYSAEEHNMQEHIKLLELDENLIETVNTGDRVLKKILWYYAQKIEHMILVRQKHLILIC